MITDYTQNKDSIHISYVNKDRQISVEEIVLVNGFYKFVECDEHDPEVIPNRKSFHGSSFKKESTKTFSHHNINEFFGKDIPLNFPEQHVKFSLLTEPNPFSIDIEVLPTIEYGYSPPSEAKNPITSISITDKTVNSLLFIVKNPDHPEINSLDMGYIDNIINEALGELSVKHEYDKMVRIFDTEIEMLNVFAESINNHFHLMFGWNFITFDWLYIYTRCENLGINIKKSSPIGKMINKKIITSREIKIDIKMPAHRIITDYMMLFKESLIYNNLGSYSLDSIAEKILGLNKVSYDGNLRKLYEEDYLRFVAYCYVDTILVMLIHHATNLITVDFFQSYYTNVPYVKLSQNSISEALIYQELNETNQFLLESEKTGNIKRAFGGGYVKNPTKKIVEACFGIDYEGLYPNSMITMGLSPEKKVDKIVVNEDMYPINLIELEKWEKYKKMGYSLTPMGRIYDIKEDSLYTRIEKKLLNQRNVFKGHMSYIYLSVIGLIEKEIESRKIQNNLKIT